MKWKKLFFIYVFFVIAPCRRKSLSWTLQPVILRTGVNVMAFDDIYPEGHQSGVSIIMYGNRVATNGDIRFEPTPWYFPIFGNKLNMWWEAALRTTCF